MTKHVLPHSKKNGSGDKKSQILAAAEARFLQYGIRKTTMRDIADDLGIAVSNLYLYFSNKREIALAIAEACSQELEIEAVEILATEGHTADKLEEMLVTRYRGTIDFLENTPKGIELLTYWAAEAPETIVCYQKSFEDNILKVLEAGQAKGEFCFADLPFSARQINLAVGQFYLVPHIKFPNLPQEEDLRTLIRWLLAPWSLPKPEYKAHAA
jgi:AcrR family transcriptional regulator